MAKLGKDVDLLAFGNEIMLSGVIFSGQGRYFLCAFPLDSIPRVTHIRSR